jgi:hypothetical protein
LWFSSVIPSNCWDSTLTQATTAALHILSNSLFTDKPIIERYIGAVYFAAVGNNRVERQVFRLSPARVEDAGNTDRQASPKPSETVLTARYRVIDPSIITVSVSSLGNTKHEVSFKTRK